MQSAELEGGVRSFYFFVACYECMIFCACLRENVVTLSIWGLHGLCSLSDSLVWNEIPKMAKT